MAVSSVGMLGDGSTHGTSVSSQNIWRDQPLIGSTVRSAPSPKTSLNRRASSPMVNPCRIGMG